MIITNIGKILLEINKNKSSVDSDVNTVLTGIDIIRVLSTSVEGGREREKESRQTERTAQYKCHTIKCQAIRLQGLLQ